MPHALDRPRNRAARRVLAGAVLILSLGVVADAAVAQTAQAPAGQKPGAAQQQAQPAENPVEAQLAEIKKRLSITSAQQPQFDQFANAVKQNAQTMEAMLQKAQQSAQQSAVDGLRLAANFAQAEADNLKRLVPALEALYASLSEQQKRTADQLFSSAPPSGASPQGKRPG